MDPEMFQVHQQYYLALFRYISGFRVREVRKMFMCMRKENADVHTLIPHLGITIGQFCTGYVLKEEINRLK